MKKIYATLLMLLVGIVAFAQDKTITIKCDNYELLNVYAPGTYGDADPLAWNAETKSVQVTFTGYASGCYIEAKEGYEISKLLDNDGDNLLYSSQKSYSLSRYEVNDGDVLTAVVQERKPKVAYIKGNSEEVYVEWNQKEYTAEDQVEGQWVIPIADDDYGSIYVKANDGYRITSVFNTTNEREYLYTPGESAFISIYALEQSDNFIEVTAISLAEARTEKFSFEVVGDLSKVNLVRNGEYNGIKLTEAITEIYYDPATEVPFRVNNPESYSSYLYKVTQNGEALPRQGAYFVLEPKNGDEFVVYTDFPDVQVPVSFTFTNEGTENAISRVTVNNEEVARDVWSASDFSVKLGSIVGITFNTVYQIQFFKNESSQNTWGGTYSEAIIDEGAVKYTVTAEKQPVYQLTVNIDDPSHIKFNNSGVEVKLNPGENVLEVLQSYHYIQIQPTATGVITAITTDPELAEPFDNLTNIYRYNFVKNDMTMTITTEDFVRGNKGIVYLAEGTSETSTAEGNGWDISALYLGNNIPQRTTVELQKGYNFFDWCDADLPFSLSIWPDPVVYLNNTLLEKGSGYPSWDGFKAMTDSAVIKIYPDTVAPLAAQLYVEEGLKATITTDYYNVAAADAKFLTALPGTWCTVAIEKAEDANLDYYVAIMGSDGEPLAIEPDEDGLYGFTIDEDCMIFVATSPAYPTEFVITADSETVEIQQGDEDGTYMIMVNGTSYDENVTLSFERPEGWDGIVLICADEMFGGMKKAPAYWPTVDQVKEIMAMQGMETQQGLEFQIPADGGMHLYMGMLYVGEQVDYERGFMMITTLAPAEVPAFPEAFDVTLSSEGLTIKQETDPLGGVIITIEGEVEADELTVTVATPEGWDGFVGKVMADDPGIAPLAEQIFWAAVDDLLAEGMEKTNALTFAVPEEAAMQLGELFLYIGERADLGRIIELDVNVNKKGSGIEAINADSLINQDVYNLQGILVKAAATAEDLKALPAGLYIVGGKKVVIR